MKLCEHKMSIDFQKELLNSNDCADWIKLYSLENAVKWNTYQDKMVFICDTFGLSIDQEFVIEIIEERFTAILKTFNYQVWYELEDK